VSTKPRSHRFDIEDLFRAPQRSSRSGRRTVWLSDWLNTIELVSLAVRAHGVHLVSKVFPKLRVRLKLNGILLYRPLQRTQQGSRIDGSIGGVKERPLSKNAPSAAGLALVKNPAPNVLVEPVIRTCKDLQSSLAREEIMKHLGANIFGVCAALVEGLKGFNDQAGNSQDGKAMLTWRIFDRPKIPLVEPFHDETAKCSLVGGGLKLPVPSESRR
jgi:hypothetical protein